MAHEFVSGVFGNNKPAWHRLGTVWPGLLTIEEAIRESGVGFTVDDGTMYLWNGKDYVPVEGWKAIVRADTHEVVGIHGEDYERDNYADHFRALGFEDQKVVESMALLRKGRIAICTIRLPEMDRLFPDGSHYRSLVSAYSSHDGTYAMTYKDCSQRIECANMTRALDGDPNPALRAQRIRHTAGKDAARRVAVNIMTYAQARADLAETDAVKLLKQKLTTRQINALFDKLVPIPVETGNRQTRALNTRAKISDIYYNAPDQHDIRGTAWGFTQAVSNFVDNQANYRAGRNVAEADKDRSRAENQIISTVLKGNTLAERALELVAV